MKSVFFLLIMISFAPEAAQVVEVKFEDLPKIIKEQNKSAKAGLLFIEASQEKTGYLGRSYLPTLKLEGGHEQFQTGPSLSGSQPFGSAEAKLNVFRGGRDQMEDQIRDVQVEGSVAQARKYFASDLSQARQYYWSLVYHSELIAILQEALEQNGIQLGSAQKRISRGLTGQTDRLEFELHESILREEIESLKHENHIIQIGLVALLGMSQGSVVKPVESIPHEHDEGLFSLQPNSSKHFEVSLLNTNREIAEIQKSISNRWWTPKIDVYWNYSMRTQKDSDYSSPSDRDETALGIKLTLEIFDGFQSKSLAQSHSIQARAFELQASQQKRNLDAQIEMAKEEMKHNHELIHESEKRIAQGKVYLSRTTDEYNRGVKNSPDMLGATQKFISFKRRNLELRRDYQLSKLKFLALTSQ